MIKVTTGRIDARYNSKRNSEGGLVSGVRRRPALSLDPAEEFLVAAEECKQKQVGAPPLRVCLAGL